MGCNHQANEDKTNFGSAAHKIDPNYIGYSDSCRLGTGGVWTSGTDKLHPILWQIEWPADIIALFDDNKSSINDLELAGIVLEWLVLKCISSSLQYKHVAIFCDNVAAVIWAHKLRCGSSIASAKLLRFLGMRIHAKEASHLTPLSIAGKDNTMADIVSRAFKNGEFFSAQANLTKYFNLHFSLSQSLSWQEFTLLHKLTQQVMSCLRGEQLTMGSLLRLPTIEKNIGLLGQNMPHCGELTPSCNPSANSTPQLSSPLLLQGSGKVTTATNFKSKFQLLRQQCRPSPRPSNWLDNVVPLKKRKTTTSSPSEG